MLHLREPCPKIHKGERHSPVQRQSPPVAGSEVPAQKPRIVEAVAVRQGCTEEITHGQRMLSKDSNGPNQ